MDQTVPQFFTQVPVRELKGKGLTSTDKLVYGTIYTMLNVMEKCWLSNARIAEDIEMKAHTVSKSISKLKTTGLINIELTYKPGTRQVDKRFITLCHQKDRGYVPTRTGVCPQKDIGMSPEGQENRLTNRLMNNVVVVADKEKLVNEFKTNFNNEPNDKVKHQLAYYASFMKLDVIIDAINKSAEKNKGWDYANGILKIREKAKVKDLQGFSELDAKHNATKKPKNTRTRNKVKTPDCLKHKYDPEKDKVTVETKAKADKAWKALQALKK